MYYYYIFVYQSLGFGFTFKMPLQGTHRPLPQVTNNMRATTHFSSLTISSRISSLPGASRAALSRCSRAFTNSPSCMKAWGEKEQDTSKFLSIHTSYLAKSEGCFCVLPVQLEDSSAVPNGRFGLALSKTTQRQVQQQLH